MDALEKLARLFLDFPGIGTRQAKRFAYFLASQNPDFIESLRDALENISREASVCLRCFRITAERTGKEACALCRAPERDHTSLLILEKDTDFETVQGTGLFEGDYFVLGGTLPFLDQGSVTRERIKKLCDRAGSDTNLSEIVLACSFTAEGEHTAQYIRKVLEPIATKRPFKVSQLARGLSTGTELEYSDSATFEQALKNRG